MEPLETTYARLLPRLRRYTRALAGDCHLGSVLCQHAYAKFQNEEPFHANPMLHAYRGVSQVWLELGRSRPLRAPTRSQPEQRRVARMSPANREAFLLMAMEGLGTEEASAVLGTSESEALEAMRAAVREGGVSDAASILIIEDEFFLARELAEMDRGFCIRASTRISVRSLWGGKLLIEKVGWTSDVTHLDRLASAKFAAHERSQGGESCQLRTHPWQDCRRGATARYSEANTGAYDLLIDHRRHCHRRQQQGKPT